MRYKGSVYRPPSEAYSLIVQVTYGCSHNTCAFCSMYKEKRFAIRPLEEVLEDFRIARGVYRRVDRVFLADGDALVRRAAELYTILDTIRELFPECQRVTSYASPASIRIRTDEELRTLREKGLTMVYMGLESGYDQVLELMKRRSWRWGRRSGKTAWPSLSPPSPAWAARSCWSPTLWRLPKPSTP